MDGFVQDATYFAMDNSTLTHIKGESRARLQHDLIPLAQSWVHGAGLPSVANER